MGIVRAAVNNMASSAASAMAPADAPYAPIAGTILLRANRKSSGAMRATNVMMNATA